MICYFTFYNFFLRRRFLILSVLLQKALVNEVHSPLTGFLSESKSEVPLRMDWSMLVQTRVSLSGPSQCPTPEERRKKERERETERETFALS